MALSLRIGIFGVINMPIIIFLLALGIDGITMQVVVNNNIVNTTVINTQELVLIVFILVLIQFLIIVYKLKT